MIDQAQILRKLAIEKKKSQCSTIIKELNSPKIITIASGKGGVGKSNIVSNLAISMAKRGKKVLILDADIGMSNIDILFDVRAKDSIISVINREKILEDIIVDTRYGVKFISGGSGINHIEDFTDSQRKVFVDIIKNIKNIDYLIIDTGAGINKSLLSFIACSDEFIVITTPEPTSLTDAYSLLKATSNLGVKASVNIIINRVSGRNESEHTFLRLRSVVDRFLTLELNLIGFVLEDKKVSSCVKKQVPWIIEYPNSNIAKCIENISNKIIDIDIKPESSNVIIKKMLNIFKR